MEGREEPPSWPIPPMSLWGVFEGTKRCGLPFVLGFSRMWIHYLDRR